MKDSLCNRFEGSICGKLCNAILVSGLSRLGRNVLLMSVGIVGSCVISAWLGGRPHSCFLVEVSLYLWSAGDICFRFFCVFFSDCVVVDDVGMIVSMCFQGLLGRRCECCKCFEWV